MGIMVAADLTWETLIPMAGNILTTALSPGDYIGLIGINLYCQEPWEYSGEGLMKPKREAELGK